MSTIGERAKQKREERGWTQQELADRLNGTAHEWTQATVWAVETSRRNLRLAEATVIANALCVSLDWLAGVESGGPDPYTNGYRDGLDAARKAIEALS